MPRRLLRDRHIAVDEWRYVGEASSDSETARAGEASSDRETARAGEAAGEPEAAGERDAAGDAPAPLILPFDLWQSERDSWIARGGRLGVQLLPSHDVQLLAPDLGIFALVAAQFPGPSEGRGYTQGRLLRERWNFKGELRATGYVRLDQLFFLARCGFNSFELPDADIEEAGAAFTTFSAAYQPSNDLGLPVKLPRDIPASA